MKSCAQNLFLRTGSWLSDKPQPERTTVKMNLILCSENCKHQKDGYCCLDEYGRITDVISSPCVYFDERKEDKENDKDGKPD